MESWEQKWDLSRIHVNLEKWFHKWLHLNINLKFLASPCVCCFQGLIYRCHGNSARTRRAVGSRFLLLVTCFMCFLYLLGCLLCLFCFHNFWPFWSTSSATLLTLIDCLVTRAAKQKRVQVRNNMVTFHFFGCPFLTQVGFFFFFGFERLKRCNQRPQRWNIQGTVVVGVPAHRHQAGPKGTLLHLLGLAFLAQALPMGFHLAGHRIACV